MIKRLTALLSSTALTFSLFVPAVSADQTTVLDGINAATVDTIAAAVESYLTEAGKTEPYASLPACDKTEINKRILGKKPFESVDALSTAYQKALENTTGIDPTKYSALWTEDFSNYSTENWTETGMSFRGNQIGTGYMDGIGDQVRKTLNITGEDYSAGFVGAPTASGHANYIRREINDSNSIVTAYFYDQKNDPTPRYNIKVNDTTWVGRTDNSGKFSYVMNGNDIALTDVNVEKGWHKVVFDGLTNLGTVTVYLDGTQIGQTAQPIKYLQLGNEWMDDGYDIVWMDNISVAASKSAEELLASFNASTITEETLKAMMTTMGKDDATFSQLPGCDKTAIMADLETKKPFGSVDDLSTSYQKALENTTGIDPTKYSALWTEDFSNYSTNNWTETGMSFRGNQIGKGYMDGIGDQVRKTLNITGEDCSAGFVGASLAPDNANRNANYIKRAISDSNSIVTAYFYDNMNDKVKPRYNIKVNDTTWVGRTPDNSGKFSYAMNGNIAYTDANVESGWHKVVFDGLTKSGTVTVYLDGTQIGQTAQPIEYLQLGNEWTEDGYDIVWMDNISVAVAKREETLSITCDGSKITTLPADGTVQVKVTDPDLLNDYIIAGYKNERMVNAYTLKKSEMTIYGGEVNIDISGFDTLKVFKWNSIDDMSPALNATVLKK